MKRIAIIDDNKSFAQTLVSVFKLNRYTAASANSAEEAMRLVGQLSPDLVLLDYNLEPEINSISLAEEIKKICPASKVIVMSGNPRSKENVYGLIECGTVAAFIDKPFNFRDFFVVLGGACAGRTKE